MEAETEREIMMHRERQIETEGAKDAESGRKREVYRCCSDSVGRTSKCWSSVFF